MKTAHFKFGLFLLVAASLLLAGCPSAPPDQQPAVAESAAEGPTAVGAGNLTVTISSPVDQQLYGVPDPQLSYVVTEGSNNTEVSADRIAVGLYDLKDGVRDKGTNLGSLVSGASLPIVPDGSHEIEFTVNDANGNPAVVVNIRYATDATPPEVTLIGPSDGLLTNDRTPRLEYSISDSCFETNSCGEQVIVDETVRATRNGQDLDELADGSHTVTVIYTDPAGHTAQQKTTFSVDATPPAVVVEPPPPPEPPAEGEPPPPPGNDPIEESSTVNTEVGDLNFTANEPGQATVYLDPSETCEGSLLEGTVEDSCTDYSIATVEFEQDVLTSVPVAGLSYGQHVLLIVASDGLGNLNVRRLTFTRADVTAPKVAVVEPIGLKDNLTVPLGFSATDDDTTQDSIEVLLQLSVLLPDGGGWQDISPAGLDLEGGTLTVAADGDYLLTITATDHTGNQTSITSQFTVDTTPPAVTLSSPPNGEIVTSAEPLLEYSHKEPALLDETVHLFAGLFSQDAVNPFNAVTTRSGGLLHNNSSGTLPEGDHTVVVSLTDLAGNTNPVPSTGTSTFTVNALGPEISLLDPEQGQVFAAGDVTVRYRAFEFSRVEIWKVPSRGDPVLEQTRAWSPADVPEGNIYADTVNFPEDGEYSIRLVAIDDTNTHPKAVAAITILVNSKLPTVAITLPTEGNRFFRPDENIQVDYNVGNADSLEFRVDKRLIDGIDINSSTPVSLDSFSKDQEGVHFVSVKVTNHNGSSSDEESFVIDGTPPVITAINSPAPEAIISRSSVTVLYSAIELNGIAKETLTVDTVQLDGFKNGDTIQGLSVGEHTLELKLTDPAGNVSKTAAVHFTVDTTPPTVTITSPKEGEIVPITTAKLAYTLSDNTDIARITVLLDGTDQGKVGKNGLTFSGLAQGDHVVKMEVEDLAGNISEAVVRNFIVDSLPPVVTIQSPVDQSTQQSNTVVLEYSIEDGTGIRSVEVRRNGTVVEGAKSGMEFTNLKSGSHTFTVQATDLAGHVSFTATSHVKIDGTAPVITITAPTQKAYLASTSVTLTYSVEESNGVVSERVWFDGGGPLSNGRSGITLDGLEEGKHYFEVVVSDQAGNESGKARVDFTVDVTPPDVHIGSPEDGRTYEGTSIPLYYNIKEFYGVSEQTVWLDGTLVPGAHSGSTLQVAYGPHYLEVGATDLAGNPSLISRVDFATLQPPPSDETPPEVTIYSPKANEVYPFGTSLTLSFKVIEEGAVAKVTVAVDDVVHEGMKSGDKLGDLKPGPHHVEVSADDIAGNLGAAFRVEFTIEPPPPDNEGTIIASKDAYLRKGRHTTNEGGSPKLLVGDTDGGQRSLVGFDLSEISVSSVQSAVLVLTIDPSAPPSNWGPRGHTVDAHALLKDWTESGVTWDCADQSSKDDDKKKDKHHHHDNNADCKDEWNGGSYEEKPSDWAVHTSGMTGTVEWDVTEDVQKGISSWLLMKHHGSGNAQYYSKEGASAAGDMSLAPTLIVSGQPSGGALPIVKIWGPLQRFKYSISTAYVGYSVYAPNGVDKEEVWVNGEPLEIHGDGHHNGHHKWWDGWKNGNNRPHHMHRHWVRLRNLEPGEYTVVVQVSDQQGNKSELTEVTFSVRDPEEWKSGKVSCSSEDVKGDDDDANQGFLRAFSCTLSK